MSQPVLPDPPDKFSSYDLWKELLSAAVNRSQALWSVRDEMLRALDDTIASHQRQHSRLSAAYEDERRRYLAAYDRFEVASAGSAELESLKTMYRHLATATRLYDKLLDGRERIDRKFAAWVDLHGLGSQPESAAEPACEVAERRDANRKLAQLRRHGLQERQDALNNRLVLGNLLRDIEQRVQGTDVCPVERKSARAPLTKSLRELNELLTRFASTSDSDELADRRSVRP